MTNTIDIMFELLDNISDEWEEEKVFIYGQHSDLNTDPTNVLGVRAKSGEEGRILLHFQCSIMEGRESAARRDDDAEIVQHIIHYYNNQTTEQVRKTIMKSGWYEILTFDLGEKIIFDIEAYEVPDWIEKYYTGDSKEFLRSYNINMEQSEVEIWDMKKIKKELNSIR